MKKLGLVAALATFSVQLAAQNTTPWFEIELIAFARTSSPVAKEQFTQEITPIPISGSLDLLKPLYQPDIQALYAAEPLCEDIDSQVYAEPTTELSSARLAQRWPRAPFRTQSITELLNIQLQSLALQISPTPHMQVTAALEALATDETYRLDSMPPEQSISLVAPQNPLAAAFDLPVQLELAQHSLAQSQINWSARLSDRWTLLCQQPVYPTLSAEPFSDWAPFASLAAPAVLPSMPPVPTPLVHTDGPYLVDDAALQLKDLSWQLAHRGNHQVLLHTAWRAALAGKKRSLPLRFYAGQQFSSQFDYQGQPRQLQDNEQIADVDQMQQAIGQTYQALQQGKLLSKAMPQGAIRGLPTEVWQFDGFIQAYNERMLFADLAFNFRELAPNAAQLATYYTSSNLRLLLGELYYIDHPKFGIVLQIRRYTPPSIPEVQP